MSMARIPSPEYEYPRLLDRVGAVLRGKQYAIRIGLTCALRFVQQVCTANRFDFLRDIPQLATLRT